MTESKSKFIQFNNSQDIHLDEKGNPLNGIRVYADDYDNGEKTLLRFRDGKLDGDIIDTKGNLIMQKPAVETNGHLEYWRNNKLHRDNNEPAVYTKGFAEKEWWVDGCRIK